MTSAPSHYEILGLPESLHHEPNLAAQMLRTAYRRALLQNHPDKRTTNPLTSITTYTVDQITEAFSTLSTLKSRAKYDSELKFQRATQNGGQTIEIFHTGIETVDLDDLEVDYQEGIWFRSCRCGDDRGFLVKEADLEEAESEGELSVGCRGCSLWLKVLFGVIEDEGPEEQIVDQSREDHEEK